MNLGDLFRRAKSIVGLEWSETSGVDHSANNEEGWAVIKSAPAPVEIDRSESVIGEQEENDMSDNDSPEFEAFRDKLQAALDSCPTEDDKARFTQIIAQLAQKIDASTVTKSTIRKSAREQVLDVLDRLSEQHAEAGLIQKGLRDSEQTQAERALLNEPESTTPLPFVDVVMAAIKRAAFTVPQIAPLNMYEKRAREVRKEIAEEEAAK